MNNAPVGCDGFFVDAVGPPDMHELFANAKCSSRYGPRRSNTSEAYSYRNMYCLAGSLPTLLVDAFNVVVVEEMDAMLLRVLCRDADVAKATIAARVKKEGNMEYLTKEMNLTKRRTWNYNRQYLYVGHDSQSDTGMTPGLFNRRFQIQKRSFDDRDPQNKSTSLHLILERNKRGEWRCKTTNDDWWLPDSCVNPSFHLMHGAFIIDLKESIIPKSS